MTKGNSASLWFLTKFSFQAIQETQLPACKNSIYLFGSFKLNDQENTYTVFDHKCYTTSSRTCYLTDNRWLLNEMCKFLQTFMAEFCYFLDHPIRTKYRILQSLLAVRGWTIEVKLLHKKIVFWQLATAVGKLLEDASQASDPCHSPDRPPDSVSFRIFPFLISSLE